MFYVIVDNIIVGAFELFNFSNWTVTNTSIL